MAPWSDTPSKGDLSKDIALLDGPCDTISSLAFSDKEDWLAAASWDGTVKCYDVSKDRAGTGPVVLEFGHPVLSCHWAPDGHTVVGGATDGTARTMDLLSPDNKRQVAQHDGAISSVRFCTPKCASSPVLATTSWDKTLRYWDLRQSAPIGTWTASERIYAMDARENTVALVTADKRFMLFDLAKPSEPYLSRMANLQQQIRTVAVSHNASQFAIGGVAGVCVVRQTDRNQTYTSYQDDKLVSQHESLKTQDRVEMPSRFSRVQTNKREPVAVYAINSIAFHPTQHQRLAIAGSNGVFGFWNHRTKQCLTRFRTDVEVDIDATVAGKAAEGGVEKYNVPITAGCFNKDGSLYAYALGYDWSRGYAWNSTGLPTKVMLHSVLSRELS